MQKVALLNNPLARRNRKDPRLADELERILGPCGVRLDSAPPAPMAEAVQRIAQLDPPIIAVNGGDGTLSAVLTALFEKPRFERQPDLALLRGGTLNMCAGDVGLKGRPAAALRRLLARAAAGGLEAAVAERNVIRVRRGGGAPPLCGLFFAAGSLYRAVRFSYEEVPGRDRSPRRHAARGD